MHFNPSNNIQVKQGEHLVSLKSLTPAIQIFPYYYHQRFPHALPDCYVREGVAEKLLQASKLLPPDHQLVVLDGFRPYPLQVFLYEKFREDFLKSGRDLKELEKYVATPSLQKEKPSPHLTGGAVDVTIRNTNGWLEMGTDFDEFSDQAQADWYEQLTNPTQQEINIRNNRRLLKEIMEECGFVPYQGEWWHFDYGNVYWAKATGQAILYDAISPESLV